MKVSCFVQERRGFLLSEAQILAASIAAPRVAVIGGGITGALVAHEFSAHGHDVVVLEGRDIAWGSTPASTALLQYEIDTHLVDLARRYGEPAAALAYRSCVGGVEQIAALARQPGGFGFARMKSLYYAPRTNQPDGRILLAQDCAPG